MKVDIQQTSHNGRFTLLIKGEKSELAFNKLLKIFDSGSMFQIPKTFEEETKDGTWISIKTDFICRRPN